MTTPNQSPNQSPTQSRTTAGDEKSHTTPWVIVMRRELMVKLTDKGFLFGTLFTLLLIGGFLGYSAIRSSDPTTYSVGVVAADRAAAEAAATKGAALDPLVRVEWVDFTDAAAAPERLKAGDLDAFLSRGTSGWSLLSQESQSDLLTVLGQGLRTAALTEQAAKLGTTPEKLEAESSIRAEFLTGDAERVGIAEGVGFAFAFIFYMAALMFGITIANSVVEEKQSRIVEIIATAIPLRHLLAGKILGNTALALSQILLYAGVGLVGLSFTAYSGYLGMVSGPVLWFILFFVAGFVALACLWAVAGALASRTEDLQATTTPLTMLILAVFFGALFADGGLKTVLSFVPPVSAVLMPTRILEGGVPIWQPLLALAILAAFAMLTIRLGERLYRRSLLQTGGRVSLRRAWSTRD